MLCFRPINIHTRMEESISTEPHGHIDKHGNRNNMGYHLEGMDVGQAANNVFYS